MREKAELPRLDHLLVPLVVRTNHQGHVALGEPPPLAPRNKAPKAEVEAVEGGAEEGPAVPNSPSELEVTVPVLANADQEPFPELSLLLLQTRQTTQCVAAEQLWIRQNP